MNRQKLEETKDEELRLEEIAKIIDPEGTFLKECRKVVKNRFNLTDKQLDKIDEDKEK